MPISSARPHQMVRPFTEEDFLEVRDFAREHIDVIESFYPRDPGEHAEAFVARVSALPDLVEEATYQLGFLHGLIAGVGGSLDELLNSPEDVPPSTRRLRVLGGETLEHDER